MGLETVRPGRPRHGHCFLINLSLSLSLRGSLWLGPEMFPVTILQKVRGQHGGRDDEEQREREREIY